MEANLTNLPTLIIIYYTRKLDSIWSTAKHQIIIIFFLFCLQDIFKESEKFSSPLLHNPSTTLLFSVQWVFSQKLRKEREKETAIFTKQWRIWSKKLQMQFLICAKGLSCPVPFNIYDYRLRVSFACVGSILFVHFALG